MDSGIAAVLGAAVGAAGTVAAGLVSGWASRSTTRLQLRAEHVRLLREPRRSAYLRYAERYHAIYGQLSDAEVHLRDALDLDNDERHDDLEDARRLIREADTLLDNGTEELAVAVQVEGPSAVREAVIAANSRLHSHRVVTKRMLHALMAGEATQEQMEQLREIESASWDAYDTFVDAVSVTLQADGISTTL
ncbi:hypothetical protein ABZZ74_40245 [Streptomyces sp. NPDC006476]|uniref:hypothetical protein n=1 Tax=Streptomyces sp. NPDC006476 TaxID=3157175 RepID=UPI0033BC7129